MRARVRVGTLGVRHDVHTTNPVSAKSIGLCSLDCGMCSVMSASSHSSCTACSVSSAPSPFPPPPREMAAVAPGSYSSSSSSSKASRKLDVWTYTHTHTHTQVNRQVEKKKKKGWGLSDHMECVGERKRGMNAENEEGFKREMDLKGGLGWDGVGGVGGVGAGLHSPPW